MKISLRGILFFKALPGGGEICIVFRMGGFMRWKTGGGYWGFEEKGLSFSFRGGGGRGFMIYML